jgi:hypothetical protein
MRVDRRETVGGVPLIKVRNLMRHIINSGNVRELMRISRDRIAEFIDADIADALVQAGYLAISDERRYVHKQFAITDLGISLSNARFMKRISRAKANAIIEDMLHRADAINANSDLIYWVAELRAFGSFITDITDLGDIDVAAELHFKKEKGDISEANKVRAKRSGRWASLSIMGWYCFGELEVLSLLRARSRYISLQPMDHVKKLGCQTKLLYPRPSE